MLKQILIYLHLFLWVAMAAMTVATLLMSKPYRYKMTARWLGVGCLLFLVAGLLNLLPRLFPLNILAIHFDMVKMQSAVQPYINYAVFLTFWLGATSYFMEVEDKDTQTQAESGKLDRSTRLGYSITIAMGLIAVLGIIPAVAGLLEDNRRPLVLRSDVAILPRGARGFGVANLSKQEISKLVITFKGHVDDNVVCLPAELKIKPVMEIPVVLVAGDERIFRITLPDMRKKSEIDVLIFSNEALANFANRSKRTFEAPAELEVWDNNGPVPVNSNLQLTYVPGSDPLLISLKFNWEKPPPEE